MSTKKYDYFKKRNQNFITRAYRTCSDYYKTPKYHKTISKIKKIHNETNKLLSSRDFYKNKKNNLTNFHQSLLLKKLDDVTFQDKNNIETFICQTERGIKTKPYKDYCFLTKLINLHKKHYYPNCETVKNNYYIKSYSNKSPKKSKIKLNKNKNKINTDLLIPAQCFLKLDLRKYYMQNYPDLVKPKTSDFIDEIKAVRKLNFITDLRSEASKFKQDLLKFNLEECGLDLYSLKKRKKLFEKYYNSFLEYHKYLFDIIRKEQTKLAIIIDKENLIYKEIDILSKKIEKVNYDLEVNKKYKRLYDLIQNKINSTRVIIPTIKKKINNVEIKKNIKPKMLKGPEKIKRNFRSSKQFLSSKEINSFQNNISNGGSKKNIRDKKLDKNNSNPRLSVNQNYNKYSLKNSSEKLSNDRFKKPKRRSVETEAQVILIENKDNSDEKNENNNVMDLLFGKNFGEVFQNETEIIENKIVNSMEKYISLYSDNFEMKIKNHLNDKVTDPKLILIHKKINELNILKTQNLSLNKELIELVNQHDDNTFMFFMTRKMRNIISKIINFDCLKDFVEIFNKLKQLYKINPEKISYCSVEKQRKNTFKYIRSSITEVENLFNGIITMRNEIKKDFILSDKLEEIEDKFDRIKKFEKNKNKRIEEMKKRTILNENMMKKMNKIFCKPIKPVAQKFNFSFKKIKNQNKRKTSKNEYDELFNELNE